jgi:hypothetical protein
VFSGVADPNLPFQAAAWKFGCEKFSVSGGKLRIGLKLTAPAWFLRTHQHQRIARFPLGTARFRRFFNEK